MQIGKAQNGRNLCAREWLARNKTGSAAEFKTYYDGLSDGQKKSYNELAAKKVFFELAIPLSFQLLATSPPLCIILIILAQGSLSATVLSLQPHCLMGSDKEQLHMNERGLEQTVAGCAEFYYIRLPVMYTTQYQQIWHNPG
ncbi:hypothetical protein BD769DRAFT_1384926 [Suillus cothurnatus]|nr:hypothetical protein BD769DRAFT_1384926 [Suillus cothurnatus]